MYFMSINKVRPGTDPAALAPVVAAHVDWVNGLITRGVVRQAGRWGESGGMMIIKAQDQAEAEALQQQDPFVTSGVVSYELARLDPDVDPG